MTNREIKDIRQPDYDIDPIYLQRWSSRSFSDRDVSDDDLFSLLEAARWAPSANNIQPWRFIVARKKEDREKFYEFILPGNRLWCEKAPALVLNSFRTGWMRKVEKTLHTPLIQVLPGVISH